MGLSPKHPKRDQNPKFTPLSETTSIPVCFIWESPPPGSILVLGSCIVFVASAYVALYFEVRRHEKLIKGQQMPQEETESFAKENKALKTSVYVVGALVLCFAPVVAVGLTFKITERKEVALMFGWVRTIAMSNSLLNPLLYCWRQKRLRQYLFKTTMVVHPVE